MVVTEPMNKRHEVRSTDYPHNMAAWLSEKAEFATGSAAWLIEILSEDDEIAAGTRERMETALSYMLHNLTKVLSFATGGPWLTSDADVIFRRGHAGFEEVCVRYGLLAETTEHKKRREALCAVDELEQLLGMDRGSARPRIHEVLAQSPRIPFLNEVAELTEAVTQGEIEWEDYRHRARKLTNDARDMLADDSSNIEIQSPIEEQADGSAEKAPQEG